MLTSEKITQVHLARTAYLYVRQSSLKQVFENTESTKRQYALRDKAIVLGWTSENIKVIDNDLGISGASTADRLGFQFLVAEVGLGKAGIVMGLEVSRLARNSADWHRLVEICALTNTLILDEDGVYNPRQFNDRLLLGLKGTMSEAELHFLKERLQGGLLNKAQRAELEIPIPTGFVYDSIGKIILDPDIQVQESISELFTAFRRIGSALGVVKFFNAQELKFPIRIRTGAHKGELHWDKLRHSSVLHVLHNPCYAGAYVFGKTHTEKTLQGKYHTTHIPLNKCEVFVKNAHPAYILLDEFEQNLKTLRENANAYTHDRRCPPREGPALLQGICICGRCGKHMTIRYHPRQGRLIPDYVCQREGIEFGSKFCQVINGSNIDREVEKIILEKVDADSVRTTLDIEAELRERIAETDQLRHREVERAKYEVSLAERRYRHIDPENRLVARTLETEWNEKLRFLEEAEQNYQNLKNASAKEIDEITQLELLGLHMDLRKLWKSDQLSHRERKKIVQLLIEDVTLLRTEENITIKIRFKGGASEIRNVPLPLRAWIQQKTGEDIVALVDKYMDKYSDEQIAKILNRRGLKTGRGKEFKKWTVWGLIKRRKLKTRFERMRDKGLLTQKELAKRCRVKPNTIRNWYRKKLITVHYYDARNRFLCEDPLNKKPILYKHHWIKPADKYKDRSLNHQGGVV